jgi:hypothetical protein
MNDTGVRGAYAAPQAPRSPLTIAAVLRDSVRNSTTRAIRYE